VNRDAPVSESEDDLDLRFSFGSAMFVRRGITASLEFVPSHSIKIR